MQYNILKKNAVAQKNWVKFHDSKGLTWWILEILNFNQKLDKYNNNLAMYDTNYRLFLHKALGVGCAPARRRLWLRLTVAKFLICNLRTISIRYLLNLFQSNFLTRYNFVDCYTSSLLHLGPSHYARDYHEYRPFFEEKSVAIYLNCMVFMRPKLQIAVSFMTFGCKLKSF